MSSLGVGLVETVSMAMLSRQWLCLASIVQVAISLVARKGAVSRERRCILTFERDFFRFAFDVICCAVLL